MKCRESLAGSTHTLQQHYATKEQLQKQVLGMQAQQDGTSCAVLQQVKALQVS